MPQKQVLSFKIILTGQLMVNIPVAAIMLGVWVTGIALFGVAAWVPSLFIGTILAWMAWSRLLVMWKDWALEKGVEKERLFKLGKWGLINFYRCKIIEESTNE